MCVLMRKWIIQTLLLGQSNLQTLQGYHVKQLQPSYHGSWGHFSLMLFSLKKFIKGGSKVWRHIAQSWEVMACMGDLLFLTCTEDIIQLNLWWHGEYRKLYFSITMDMGFLLYSKGLRQFRDVWDLERNKNLEWEEACIRYSLAYVYHDFWVKLLEH